MYSCIQQLQGQLFMLSHPHREALHEAAHPNTTEQGWQFLRTESLGDPASLHPGIDRKDLKTETQILVCQCALQHDSQQPEVAAIQVVSVS